MEYSYTRHCPTPYLLEESLFPEGFTPNAEKRFCWLWRLSFPHDARSELTGFSIMLYRISLSFCPFATESITPGVSLVLLHRARFKTLRTVNIYNLQPLRTPSSCLTVYPFLRLTPRQAAIRDDVGAGPILCRSAS